MLPRDQADIRDLRGGYIASVIGIWGMVAAGVVGRASGDLHGRVSFLIMFFGALAVVVPIQLQVRFPELISRLRGNRLYFTLTVIGGVLAFLLSDLLRSLHVRLAVVLCLLAGAYLYAKRQRT